MSEPARQLPRFIPTLTEIVDPAAFASTPMPPQADLEEVVDRIKQQMLPMFERRLQEEFNQLVRLQVASQWAQASQRLHSEMDGLIRQAVADQSLAQKKSSVGL